jgi:proline iminopeptidase
MRAILFSLLILVFACNQKQDNSNAKVLSESTSSGEVKMAGIKMIPIETPVGSFKVWTKKFGDNPRIKILLLHGGPAATHEYMECFQSFFPQQLFEFYEYDQLGSYYSDQPTDSSLWTIARFVEEVEQVRKAIGADNNNFYILGNSWGGILGMEYALKYQQHMKGLIVANMMASIPEYNKYAEEVLAKQMDPAVVAEIKELERKGDFKNPRYEELLFPHFYSKHVCRLAEWPEPLLRSFKHLNAPIYTMMQGPSEFGASGRLANWDRRADLQNISVPTLMIGAKHDTMDPAAMEAQSKMVQKGSYLFCPNGSHMAMWDDQKVFMEGVISWIRKVDEGKL